MAAAEGSFQRKTLFKRYVQIGRLCVISKGAEEGKLCTIVDVVDRNRVRLRSIASLICAKLRICYQHYELICTIITRQGIFYGKNH